MTNKIKLTFTDKSDNESGFVFYANDSQIAKLEKVDGEFAGENCELLTNNSKNANSVDEQYEVLITAEKGENEIKIASFNAAGESEKVLAGTVEIYDRSDLVIYIGDDLAEGAGSVTNLANYEGTQVENLSKVIKGSVISNNYESAGYVSGNWVDADPKEYAQNDKIGAETSFIDKSDLEGIRKTSIWKLSVPSGKIQNHFASGGSARNFIEANLQNKIAQILDIYNQARVSLLIINLPLDSSTQYQAAYIDFVNYMRNLLNNDNLPVILTDRTGEREAFLDDTIVFGIQDVGNKFHSDLAKEFNLFGYYQMAIFSQIKQDFSPESFGDPSLEYKYQHTWYKKYNLDWSPSTSVWIDCVSRGNARSLTTEYIYNTAGTYNEPSTLKLYQAYNPYYKARIAFNSNYNYNIGWLKESYSEDPTGLGIGEIIRGDDFIYKSFIGIDLPGIGHAIFEDIPSYKRNPYSTTSRLSQEELLERKRSVLPYTYDRKNDFSSFGFFKADELPTLMSQLAAEIKNSHIVQAKDLNLSSESGQIDLGNLYADVKNNFKVSGRLIFRPKIWVDATEYNGEDLITLRNYGTLDDGVCLDSKSPASYGVQYIGSTPVFKFNNTVYEYSTPFGVVPGHHDHKYLFFVGQTSADTANLFIASSDGTAESRFLSHFGWENDKVYFDWAKVNGVLQRVNANQPLPTGSSYIATFMYDKELNVVQLRLNGKVVASATNLSDSPTGDLFYFGGSPFGDRTQDVKVGEFIVTDEKIGIYGVQLAEAYLSKKWGIILEE